MHRIQDAGMTRARVAAATQPRIVKPAVAGHHRGLIRGCRHLRCDAMYGVFSGGASSSDPEKEPKGTGKVVGAARVHSEEQLLQEDALKDDGDSLLARQSKMSEYDNLGWGDTVDSSFEAKRLEAELRDTREEMEALRQQNRDLAARLTKLEDHLAASGKDKGVESGSVNYTNSSWDDWDDLSNDDPWYGGGRDTAGKARADEANPEAETEAETDIAMSSVDMAVSSVENVTPEAETEAETDIAMSSAAVSSVENVTPPEAETEAETDIAMSSAAVSSVENVAPTVDMAISSVENVTPTVDMAVSSVEDVTPTVDIAVSSVENVTSSVDIFKQHVKNLISSSAEPAVLPALEPKVKEREEKPKRHTSGRRAPFRDDGNCNAEGSGHEILLQAFNWESHKEDWYRVIGDKAKDIKDSGFTLVWMPPSSHSVSNEGYMPVDYYNLNSCYGSMEDLKDTLRKLHKEGLGAIADIIINHRCAQYQDEHGIWNKFGGKMDWDQRAIVGNDPNFRGRGHHTSHEIFHAAPNIDHRQEFVRSDIKEWLQWLREEVGFDGWRFDFAKGFAGEFVGEYCQASMPLFSVGEYWDALSYNGSSLDDNQDGHRQRIVDWINSTGGRSLAFDMTTKGILHEVIQNGEYWRLSDQDGRPPGTLGYWPSRTCTFIENHDTGSTQGHWPFPEHGIEQGYAYILTHPGTPTVFWDHYMSSRWQPAIKKLIQIRKENGIHCRSRVHILKADSGVYAAQIDDRLILKIGPHRNWHPKDKSWEKTASGHGWCVWRLNKDSREAMDTILKSSFLPDSGITGDTSAVSATDSKNSKIFRPHSIQHDT